MISRKGFVILVLLIGVWAFFQKPDLTVLQKLNPQGFTATKSSTPREVPDPVGSGTSLEKKLHQEASFVGRIDTAPEDTEERLQEWAHSLSKEELDQLEQAALDVQKPQDDRFLAVMLMAWSQKAEALENLKDIALAEINPFLNPNRKGDFERILRMQAVDGMIDLPVHTQNIVNTLRSVAAKTADSTIADRANRALWAATQNAPSPKEQDQKALDELLKKTKEN